jgi:hypothetical protein
VGPVQLSFYVDTYYGFQFWRPVDHTIFPATVAPRHNEVSLNLAMIGAQLVDVGDAIGQVRLQVGNEAAALAGNDPTLARGLFNRGQLPYVQLAYAGWHFHGWHGINLVGGILPSYIGFESYLTAENWNYTHSLFGDCTPYYMTGVQLQTAPTQDLDAELWLVNGYQTFSRFHEAPGGGYYVNWRPSERVSLVQDTYFGTDNPADRAQVRLLADNQFQWQIVKGADGARLQSLAVALMVDGMLEPATDQSRRSVFNAEGLYLHGVLGNGLGFGARGVFVFDPEQQLIYNTTPPLPLAQSPRFWEWELTGTLDYWATSTTLFRLEYVHRQAAIPYFSGTGGITGTTPDLQHHDDRILLNATWRI